MSRNFRQLFLKSSQSRTRQSAIRQKKKRNFECFHDEFLKEIVAAAEESQKREIALGVCFAAQRAVEKKVSNRTKFKDCVFNANIYTVWEMPDGQYRIEGRFEYQNVFGAFRPATYVVDVVVDVDNKDILEQFKVVHVVVGED